MNNVVQSEKSDASVGQLLGSLVNETGALVRQEIHLASTEMAQKAKKGVFDVGIMGVGGALVHVGLLALIAAVILGLGTIVPMWVSAGIIGVVAAGVGWAITRTGMSALRGIDPLPQRTIETLQQDKTWMKEQLR